MRNNLQILIFQSLIQNEEFKQKALPHLKVEYFEEESHQILFSLIDKFTQEYNTTPTKQEILIELSKQDSTTINEELTKEIVLLIKKTFNEEIDPGISLEWLLKNTEEWCQTRAIYLSVYDSINILDGKNKNLGKHAIPDLLKDALAVSFDKNIGHDYLVNFEERFESYKEKEYKFPFDIDLLNKITRGGIERKTLNCFLGGTGAGKTRMMCHLAASYLAQSYNVLYITLEMSETKIAERIDANLLNVSLDDLDTIPTEVLKDRVHSLIEKTSGQLIIKEYPTSSAHVGHFRVLLNELQLKKNFKPDIVIIDYLNICASSRLKGIGGTINSYTYVKNIAEEVRGFAVEQNLPVITATQTNRIGAKASDLDMADTSDSFALPMVLDLFIGLVATEDLQKRGQMMIKQLKNRYGDPSIFRRFFVGVDGDKMRLYNLEESAAIPKELSGDDPVNEEEEFIDKESSKLFNKDEEGNDIIDFSDFTY